MATLGDIKDAIIARLGQDITDQQVVDAINETIRRVSREQWYFATKRTTITLNQGDPVVPNLPSDFKREARNGGLVIDYSDTRYVLRKLTPDQYQAGNVEADGIPRAYFNLGEELRVYPYPSQAYDLLLNYVIKPSTLVNDGDSNEFTENADLYVRAQTLADIYLDYRHDSQLYGTYRAKADYELQELRALNRARLAADKMVPNGIMDARPVTVSGLILGGR